MTIANPSPIDHIIQAGPSVQPQAFPAEEPARVRMVPTPDDIHQIRQTIWSTRYHSDELLKDWLLGIVMDPPNDFVKTERSAAELLNLLEAGAAAFDEVGLQVKHHYDVFVATKLSDPAFVRRVAERYLRERQLEWFKTMLDIQ